MSPPALMNAVLATMALVATLQPAAGRGLLAPALSNCYEWLDLKLYSNHTVKNVENRAVGNYIISNPSSEPWTVGVILYEATFMMTNEFRGDPNAMSQMMDLEQTNLAYTCGSRKLPTTLAPGETLSCPFSSRMNIYGGEITVVSSTYPANTTPEEMFRKKKILSINCQTLQPYDPSVRGPPGGMSGFVKKKYTANKDKAIPAHDIECEVGQQFCKVCGGQAAVEAKCNAVPICVAYDMEDNKCGYIKQAKGPTTTKAGFTSWVVV